MSLYNLRLHKWTNLLFFWGWSYYADLPISSTPPH